MFAWQLCAFISAIEGGRLDTRKQSVRSPVSKAPRPSVGVSLYPGFELT